MLRLRPVTTRRVRRLDIDADMFLSILRGMDGMRRIRAEGLPDDARCVGITTDDRFNTVSLWLESEAFAVVSESAVVEPLYVNFTEYSDGHECLRVNGPSDHEERCYLAGCGDDAVPVE